MRKGVIVEWDGDVNRPFYHTGKVAEGGERQIVVEWDTMDGRKLWGAGNSLAFTKRPGGEWLPLGKRKANPLVRM